MEQTNSDVTISKQEYENLLFHKKQIEEIKAVANELHEDSIDPYEFETKIMDIIF